MLGGRDRITSSMQGFVLIAQFLCLFSFLLSKSVLSLSVSTEASLPFLFTILAPNMSTLFFHRLGYESQICSVDQERNTCLHTHHRPNPYLWYRRPQKKTTKKLRDFFSPCPVGVSCTLSNFTLVAHPKSNPCVYPVVDVNVNVMFVSRKAREGNLCAWRTSPHCPFPIHHIIRYPSPLGLVQPNTLNKQKQSLHFSHDEHTHSPHSPIHTQSNKQNNKHTHNSTTNNNN